MSECGKMSQGKLYKGKFTLYNNLDLDLSVSQIIYHIQLLPILYISTLHKIYTRTDVSFLLFKSDLFAAGQHVKRQMIRRKMSTSCRNASTTYVILHTIQQCSCSP